MSAGATSLANLQAQFMAALRDATALPNPAPALTAVIRAGAFTAAERLNIYRNNYRANFRAVLALEFPVIEQLTGTDYFAQLAADYQRQHPSQRGDLQHVGGEFAGFLRSRFMASEYQYFADIAVLEWALQEVTVAAELTTRVDASTLAGIDPERYTSLQFQFAAAMRLVTSPFPILKIWRAHRTEHAATLEQIDLRAGGESLLVYRGRDDIVLRALPAAEFAWLNGLLQHSTLGDALDAAWQVDEQFDPSAPLAQLFTAQLVHSLT